MEKEVIDVMKNHNLTPEEFITLMFERTSEDGILYVPALYRTEAGWFYGVPDFYEEESYRCKMDWNLFKYEKIVDDVKMHIDTIRRIVKNKDSALSGKDLEFYNKYLKDFDIADIDEEKVDDISERIDITAWVKYIAKQISEGEEISDYDRSSLAEFANVVVTKEEHDYFDKYVDAVFSDAEKRVGGSVCSYKVISFSRRLAKLYELDAPEIVTKNEERLLAQSIVLNRFCKSYEVVDNTVRLHIERLESMDESELDEMFRPQKMNSPKSMAPLFVYSILKDKSSAKKHLRQQEILKELAKYPYEVSIERKALSRIIHNLAEYPQYAIFHDKTGVWVDQEDK